MKSPEPKESCDAGAKNVKRTSRKGSESWSDSCVCQVDFLQSFEKGEENVIQVLPFKCQLSSSLGTGSESGPLSVASVCEWLLVSFDLISILTWGALLDIWNRHAQRHTCFLTHSVQRPQFFSGDTRALFMRTVEMQVVMIWDQRLLLCIPFYIKTYFINSFLYLSQILPEQGAGPPRMAWIWNW